MDLYDQTPLRRAEKEILNVEEAIADVPPFTMTIDLDDCQGTLVIESGLDETKIVKRGTTLDDPVAIAKVILAAHDTLAALDLKDIVRNGFRPKMPRKQRRSRTQKNAPVETGGGAPLTKPSPNPFR